MGFPSLFVIHPGLLFLYLPSYFITKANTSRPLCCSTAAALRLISLYSICLNLRDNVLFKDAAAIWNFCLLSLSVCMCVWGMIVLNVDCGPKITHPF